MEVIITLQINNKNPEFDAENIQTIVLLDQYNINFVNEAENNGESMT